MTLPQHVPPQFKDAVTAFADSLQANFSSLIAANPEDQLKGPVQALVSSVAKSVETRTEAQLPEIGARPDIGVTIKKLLCGYIELKAPGKGARVAKYKGADKVQWEKFKAVPNILYTDGSEWALYRSGKSRVLWPGFSSNIIVDGADAVSEDDIVVLHTLLVDFLNWEPTAPSSPKALAEILAPICRLLREDVLEAITDADSSLAQLAQEWRAYLFPDADDARFADAYAQTLTYALLLARLSGETDPTTEKAAAALDSGHGLLAQALRVLSQPEAKAEIATAVDLLERITQAVEPTKLQKRGDPWLYFYEDFLSIYDPKLRKDYGVYYTPVPVIGAQVRLVSQLLEDRFGKKLSYADEGVVFLDPAAGTAAYPLGAIDYALEKAGERFGEGIQAAKASDCAVNFHAFEILVGPYAVGHLRLTQLISDYGGTLPDDGIRVFLTDTLESPHANPPQPNLFARKLTEEHRRAQGVKKHTRVLVCMGNPPYDREEREVDDESETQRKGGWVRHGDPGKLEEEPVLLDFIRPAVQTGAGVHVKNLYNDYVYFWRWALWKLYENPEANGPGIISFITASSYLRGPGFVGMRQKMRESFDELWILDLEGDNRGARKTENVFAITTPVAIAIGVRYGEPAPRVPAVVRYSKITGTREEKLAWLDRIQSFKDLKWQDCFNDWMQPFLPQGTGDYFGWPLLTDLFPWQHSGVQFKRTWPIAEAPEVLSKRWKAMLAKSVIERSSLLRERKANGQYRSFINPRERLPTIAQLETNTSPLEPTRYAFRSFDRQWVLPDARLCDRPRPPLWLVRSESQIYLTSLLTGVLGLGPSAVVSPFVPDLHHFRGSFGGKDVIPLYRDAQAEQPNITNELLNALEKFFGKAIAAEDFFAYCYTILASRTYVDIFSEELSNPGPRLPITKVANLFWEAVKLGRMLIWLHTFGERFVPEGKTPGEVPQGRARSIRGVSTQPDNYPEGFSFESTPQGGLLRVGDGKFGPVSDDVWNFSVSGLPVLYSWLNYRKRSGAGKASSPLDKIRPERWTGAMEQELLEVIWVLEATVAMYPELGKLFRSVIQGPTFSAAELPKPSDAERRPPQEEEEESPQIDLEM